MADIMVVVVDIIAAVTEEAAVAAATEEVAAIAEVEVVASINRPFISYQIFKF
jgi:hypothetical protein